MNQNPYERPADDESARQTVDRILRDTFYIALKRFSELDPDTKDLCLGKVRSAKGAIQAAIEGNDRFLANEAVRVISHLESASDYSINEPDKNDFSALGLSFFQEFQPSIEKVLEKKWAEPQDVLDGYGRLATSEDAKQSIMGVSGLASHLDLIRKGFFEKKEHFKEIGYCE